MRAFLVVVLLGLVVAAHAGEPQRKSAPAQDIRGTEKSPLIVKGLPSEKTKQEEDREQEKLGIDRDMRDLTRDLRNVGNATVWLTVLLAAVAVVQAGLFAWQLRLMNSSARTAEAAANAALAQSEAMRHAERAYVRILHQLPGVKLDGDRITVRYAIKNYGQTPAEIIGSAHSCAVLEALAELEGPDFVKERTIRNDTQIILARDEGYTAHYSMRVNEGEGNLILDGDYNLFLFSYVDYRDVFGRTHRSTYCRVYRPELDDPLEWPNRADQNNLVYASRPGFNYDREISADESTGNEKPGPAS